MTSSYRQLRRPEAAARIKTAAPAVRSRIGPALSAVQPIWQATTPAGRAAAAVAIGSWLLGLRLGWQELFLVAACCTIALLVGVGFVLGRPTLDVSIELDPARVTVGSPAAGRLVAVNRSRARLRPLSVELPVRSEEHTSELQSPCNLVCR